MTREELINHIKYNLEINADVFLTDEDARMVIKALGQDPCEDVAKERYEDLYKVIKNMPPVVLQPKMGCEGCTYEKTGNNSTYPCSHCSRCYTDKYEAESEGEG